MSPPRASTDEAVRSALRAKGLRWTPQRRLIIATVRAAPDHVTGAEIVERCRAVDRDTTPSTVYRTLEVLEELGIVRHAHGLDGREEYHVRPGADHAHLLCSACGSRQELDAGSAQAIAELVSERHGFAAAIPHLTMVGTCAGCTDDPDRPAPSAS
jgi:Fur family transcriptional regulator, ferric uptake regulator